MKTSLAGVGAAAGLCAVPAVAQQPKKKAVLNICSQEGRVPGKSFEEKVAKLVKWGATGLEVGGNPANRVKQIKNGLKGTKIKVSALCWGACGGKLVSSDAKTRKEGIDALKRALTTAGELEAVGVIFVPAFNNDSKLPNKEIRKILLDVLPNVGEHAVKCKTRVLLEPLNRREAFFLRQIADAASIARDSKSPGIAVMGDFYHMFFEETSDMGAFISGGNVMRHVHLASRKRILPGQDDRSFVDGFRGLKMIGYQDYCSLECGCKGDPNVEIPKSFRFLERQWEEATI